MRIYKLLKCSETESDKLIWKHLCSSPGLCQHHLDNYKRAWFKGLLWCVLICLFQNESRRLKFFTCCTEDFRWIMCYLLPVASEEAEQNAGISSRSSETILAAELWWNSAHNQDHVCWVFFFLQDWILPLGIFHVTVAYGMHLQYSVFSVSGSTVCLSQTNIYTYFDG